MKSFYLLLLFPIFAFGQTLTPPTISHQSGFYADEFYLHISHPDPNVTILYTLDGSEPKFENLDGKVWNYKKVYPTNPGDAFGELLSDTSWTYKYIDSILVRDRTNDRDLFADISASYYTNEWYNHNSKPDSVNVFKGAGIRVSAYLNGVYSSIVTKNYFVSPLGVNRYSLPVTCLNVDPEIFFGYENGLNVPGVQFDEWRADNSNQPIDRMSAPANFRASGSSSEIELNYTYLVEGAETLNHGIGLRLHGNGSRYFPNRSYRLYAKSAYGASSFNYPFFSDYSETSFKRIILRNSGNDCVETMFRDAFIQQASKKMAYDIQEYQPTILFINGEYFGLYNIRERFDDKYFEQKYNIDTDDLDHLENDGLISEGDADAYNELMLFLDNNSLDVEVNYQHVSELVDIPNFTDYFLTEIFISNIDWPTNNNEYWRKRVPFDSTAPYGHDGRWRWLLKDLDYSFGYRWDNNNNEFDDLSFVSQYSNVDQLLNKSTLLFRRLLENESYRYYFINRFSDILNSTYKSDVLTSKLEVMKASISPEIEEFATRWNPQNQSFLSFHPLSSYSAWETSVNKLVSFSLLRPYWVRKHIQDRFTAGEKLEVLLDVSDLSHGIIQLNTIKLDEETDGIIDSIPYPWTGIYYKNVPITLKALAKPGYVFSHWSGEINGVLPEITVNLDHDTYIKANFISEEDQDLAVNKLSKDNQEIIVYPNPFNDNITVLADAYNGNYVVYSIDGRKMLAGDFTSKLINLESLESGVFVLEIKTNKQVFTQRIVKK